ncbi:hypothetical protein GDO78_014044 [Eleutherodactylus coqui]|uniref:Uncharacterized protein n=1 Tax=Eleutherodactylus coqui TaxID=57060 RepID=A0A8J6EF92_ELECQ|nr:hypothetical protein GDO78_014044 [Eleutherodactylus coqui]
MQAAPRSVETADMEGAPSATKSGAEPSGVPNQKIPVSSISPLEYGLEQDVVEDRTMPKKKMCKAFRRKKDGIGNRKRANFCSQTEKEVGENRKLFYNCV